MIRVELFTVNARAGVPPNVRLEMLPSKPVPVTVTVVPPEMGPDDGATEVTVGALEAMVSAYVRAPE